MPDHERVLAILAAPHGFCNPALLRPGNKMIDEDSQLAFGGGRKVRDDRFEVINAAEKLDDNSLGA